MTSPLSLLAASGWGARGVFGLAALTLVAVEMLPIDLGAPPRPWTAPPPPVAEGSAVERPLFDPGRRAWTARGSRDLILRPDPVAPVLVLRGIRLDGGQARAYLDDGSGDGSWLAVGEGRADWRIEAIARDRVTVSQGSFRAVAEFLGPPATLRPAPFTDAPPALKP